MDNKIETLHKLCGALMEELEDYAKKIEKSDGMNAGDLEAVDKLSHALKSVKTTIAMMEADSGENGYSGRYMPRMGAYYGPGGMSYADDGRGNRGGSSNRGSGSYEGRSYARNQSRDSMGRYSREGYSQAGYSYADGMEELLGEMRDMLPGLSEEKRRKAERLIAELQG